MSVAFIENKTVSRVNIASFVVISVYLDLFAVKIVMNNLYSRAR